MTSAAARVASAHSCEATSAAAGVASACGITGPALLTLTDPSPTDPSPTDPAPTAATSTIPTCTSPTATVAASTGALTTPSVTTPTSQTTRPTTETPMTTTLPLPDIRDGHSQEYTPTHLPDLADTRRVSFTRLLQVELRKLVDTRAGRWLLISTIAATVLAMGVMLWIGREDGSTLLELLAAANLPQAVLIPVLGVMTAANEWSQRTALVTFTQEPRRLRVMAAKSIAAVLLGLAVLVVTGLVAVAAHVVSMAAAGGAADLWVGWPLIVHLVVLQTLGVLMGVAFGALFLSVPVGVVAYVLVPMLSPLIFMVPGWLKEHAGWLDMGTAQQAMLTQDWLTGVQWAQVGTTTALWILLPLAAGLWRVARREVA